MSPATVVPALAGALAALLLSCGGDNSATAGS